MFITELDYNETTFSSLSQVEKFINKYGLDYTLNQRDEYGHTPTHWLALNGHAHVFRSLVQKGGKIDLHSNNGQGPRPIHWASRNGHVAVVDILLSAGTYNSLKKKDKYPNFRSRVESCKIDIY